MIDLDTWKKAWALLEVRERRTALMVLGVIVLSALSSALLVGSVLPFLSVLSQPERIETVPILAWAYETFGFKSNHGFLVGLGLATLLRYCSREHHADIQDLVGRQICDDGVSTPSAIGY